MIPRLMHAEYLGEYKIRLRFAGLDHVTYGLGKRI